MTASGSTARSPSGPATPAELAERTGTDERYVTEWLRGQAAGGYVTYDAADRPLLAHRGAGVRAHRPENGPVFLPGAFQLALGALKAQPRIAEAFRTGAGMGWHEHDDDVFDGCERFFRPGYLANLVPRGSPRSRASRPSSSRGRAGGRRRLRARRVDDPARAGVPELDVRRAPTTTRARSTRPASARPTRASADRVTLRGRHGPDVLRDGLRPRRPPSTACTTWATRSARRGTCASRSRPTGPGWWSSRSRGDDVEPTTSTRSGGSTTRSRPCSASPTRKSQGSAQALGAQAGEAAIREVDGGRRLHPVPSRGRDPVQPGLRGPSLSASPASAPSAGVGVGLLKPA